MTRLRPFSNKLCLSLCAANSLIYQKPFLLFQKFCCFITWLLLAVTPVLLCSPFMAQFHFLLPILNLAEVLHVSQVELLRAVMWLTSSASSHFTGQPTRRISIPEPISYGSEVTWEKTGPCGQQWLYTGWLPLGRDVGRQAGISWHWKSSGLAQKNTTAPILTYRKPNHWKDLEELSEDAERFVKENSLSQYNRRKLGHQYYQFSSN